MNSKGEKIAESSLTGGFVFSLAILAASAFLFLLAIANYRIVQKINNTATSKVRSAAIGLSEFHGKVVAKKRIYSPITHTPCVYWHVVYQRPHHRKNLEEPLPPSESSVPFLLEDKTGAILIEPANAIVEISNLNDFPFREGEDIDPRILEVLHSSERDAEMRAALKKYKDPTIREMLWEEYNERCFRGIGAKEYFIKEGDPLYILGTVHRKKGARSSVGHENLVVSGGRHEKLFYIRNSSERNIAKELKKSARDQFFYGFVLLLIGSLALLKILNP